MSTRRPVASPRSTALPTLVALLAAGVAVEGCLAEAHAQTPPSSDAGAHPPPPPPPPPRPPGGISRVHPPPPPPPSPPIAVEGGMRVVDPSP